MRAGNPEPPRGVVRESKFKQRSTALTPESVVHIMGQAFWTAFLVCAPLLLIGFVVGIAVNLVQIVTSLQDAAFSTIPRLAAFLAGFLILLPWMLKHMSSYASGISGDLSRYAHGRGAARPHALCVRARARTDGGIFSLLAAAGLVSRTRRFASCALTGCHVRSVPSLARNAGGSREHRPVR